MKIKIITALSLLAMLVAMVVLFRECQVVQVRRTPTYDKPVIYLYPEEVN